MTMWSVADGEIDKVTGNIGNRMKNWNHTDLSIVVYW